MQSKVDRIPVSLTGEAAGQVRLGVDVRLGLTAPWTDEQNHSVVASLSGPVQATEQAGKVDVISQRPQSVRIDGVVVSRFAHDGVPELVPLEFVSDLAEDFVVDPHCATCYSGQ